MPARTQILQQIPWLGGLNTAVDAGVIPPSDLVRADNVIFTTSGVRRKREGFTYWDALSDIPTITHRSSSGTTRTLVFNATLSNSTVDKLVAGEGITITGTPAAYTVASGTVATIGTTNVTNDTITYTTAGSLAETSTATSTLRITRRHAIVRIHDYWRLSSGAQVQSVIAVTAQPKIFRYDSSGNRKEIVADGGGVTARTGTAEKVHAITFNDKVIIAQSRAGNTPIKYDPDVDADWFDLAGTPPDFAFMAVHYNRIWTNDKANPDRLHYSATANPEKWQGADDSGALDIRPGDGDPTGIIAIFPFKGRLFVMKTNKTYMVAGDTPENFQVIDVTAGLGAIAQGAVAAVDQNDVVYMSLKGVHSLSTTSNYGDFSGSFLSDKVQTTYNTFSSSRLQFTQAAYISTLNSVAFSIAEVGQADQNAIWLYNVQNTSWYRWPDVDCQCLATILLTNKQILFYGTSNGKIVRTQNGTYTDFTNVPISYFIKSGIVYPDNSPLTLKAFKRLSVFFRPTGTYSFTARFKVDRFAEQSLVFQEIADGDLLDVDFILGQSLLGSSAIFAPSALPVDGIGRGFTLEIEQAGSGEVIDIYGYAVEWESAEIAQERG